MTICVSYVTYYYMHACAVRKCLHKGVRNANYSGIPGLCMVYMRVEVDTPFQINTVYVNSKHQQKNRNNRV